MRLLIFILIQGWTAAAAADLYRWVDPETGSVKFSSYPPPWYGDPARERRAPRVEVIPERSSLPPSAPKPEEEVRREPKPAARAVDKTPDGPAGKAPAKPAGRPVDESEPDAQKDKRADGR